MMLLEETSKTVYGKRKKITVTSLYDLVSVVYLKFSNFNISTFEEKGQIPWGVFYSSESVGIFKGYCQRGRWMFLRNNSSTSWNNKAIDIKNV